MNFVKYHALGNDYLVLDQLDASIPDTYAIQRICHRNYGLGSDGILLTDGKDDGHIRLRIFNPDGSEAEKSGNGIRIFARYLWDKKIVGMRPFKLMTKGGMVECQILENNAGVRVEMGRANFKSRDIPVLVESEEAIGITADIAGHILQLNGVSMGNPHCVTFTDNTTEPFVKTIGPVLETYKIFPNRTNVQLVQILDRDNIKIEIWERGAGYTLASGSSSCAAAAMSYKLGYCDAAISVHMPGGVISISIAPDFSMTMTGSVTRVGEMALDTECLRHQEATA